MRLGSLEDSGGFTVLVGFVPPRSDFLMLLLLLLLRLEGFLFDLSGEDLEKNLALEILSAGGLESVQKVAFVIVVVVNQFVKAFVEFISKSCKRAVVSAVSKVVVRK